MKKPALLIGLCCAVILLGIIISSVGLFYNDGGQPFEFTSLQGETVRMYGKGLYRNDSYFKGPIFRGTDAVLLFFAVPLLIISTIRTYRGSLRGKLMLTGSLVCFLYTSVSMAFGAAYNVLFLIYILQFSVSLFALILLLTSFDPGALAAHIKQRLPFKRIAFFLFFAALSPLVWLIDHIEALFHGGVPQGLENYTTDITAVLDIGVILPVVVFTGILMLKRKPQGVIFAAMLLILLVQIGLVVAGQTAMQLIDGVQLTPMEIVTFVAPFIILSLIAVWMAASLIGNISETPLNEG